MQGKGLIKFFAIVLGAICTAYLILNLLTARIEGKAASYGAEQAAKVTDIAQKSVIEKRVKKNYLDSVANKNVLPFIPISYETATKNQLKMGLDLKGGMNVILQINMPDLIKTMANYNPDQVFNQALAEAKSAQLTQNQDYVTLFGQAFERLAPPGAKLAGIFSASPELADRVKISASNADVLDFIRAESKTAIDRTFDILRTRVDKLGVSAANLSLSENTGRINVELPGIDDAERVRKMLQANAKLEFWEVREVDQDITAMVQNLANVQDAIEKGSTPVTPENVIKTDSIGRSDTDTTKNENSLVLDGDNNSEEIDTSSLGGAKGLFSFFNFYGQQGSFAVGDVAIKDTARFSDLLRSKEGQSSLPKNIKLLYAAQPNDSKDATISKNDRRLAVYAIDVKSATGKPPIDGGVITSAGANIGMDQKVAVEMAMNNDGAKKWRKLTRENIGQSVAIVMDDQVYSAPVVQDEIGGGRSSISGTFDLEEAEDLASVIKVGKLPANAQIVQEESVGPTLGKESIRKGIMSILLGFLAVVAFMILYYAKGGVVSVITLILNIIIILGVLASLKTTLTLPGIAGIVLTIGMAVDANVIIFERIKEELAKGKTMRTAISEGFTKSYSAIIDANVTSLITAIILAYFGLGPIKGFAVVFGVGIISSMFTAVLLGHFILDSYVKNEDRKVGFSTSLSEGRFKNIKLDFLKWRKTAYAISIGMLLLGLFSVFTKGFEYGVDFLGGRSYAIRFDQTVNNTELANKLAGPLGKAPLVRTFGSTNQALITTDYKIKEDAPAVDAEIEKIIYDNSKFAFADPPSPENFLKNNKLSYTKVGPNIASDITRGAKIATILSLLAIFLYIFMRFRKWTFGAGATVCTAHDALMILALFSVFAGILPFSLEIDQVFIAALLTIIGYSVNDTVIVFDRIRENIKEHPGMKLYDIINDSITQTLSRTIMTAFTVLLVVLVLFFLGGDATRGFSFAMIIGVILGTFSSIFVAAPVMYDLTQWTSIQNAKAPVLAKAGA